MGMVLLTVLTYAMPVGFVICLGILLKRDKYYSELACLAACDSATRNLAHLRRPARNIARLVKARACLAWLPLPAFVVGAIDTHLFNEAMAELSPLPLLGIGSLVLFGFGWFGAMRAVWSILSESHAYRSRMDWMVAFFLTRGVYAFHQDDDAPATSGLDIYPSRVEVCA